MPGRPHMSAVDARAIGAAPALYRALKVTSCRYSRVRECEGPEMCDRCAALALVDGPQEGSALTCPTCKDDAHDPGKCKRCNCGQSDISAPHSKTRPGELRGYGHGPSTGGTTLTAQYYDAGHLVPRRRQSE